MASRQSAWRTTVLVVGSVMIIFATGLAAGRMLELYDANIGFEREASRIAEILQVRPGMGIGDVRAGRGRWTVDLAQRVGEDGIVYATPGPVSPVHELFKTIAESGVNNVSVITRSPGSVSRLPVECCDAILLRHVYQDLPQRVTFVRAMHENLRPGGRLAIISRLDSTSPGTPTGRLSPEQLLAELRSAGYVLEARIDDWSPTSFCMVFQEGPADSQTQTAP